MLDAWMKSLGAGGGVIGVDEEVGGMNEELGGGRNCWWYGGWGLR